MKKFIRNVIKWAPVIYPVVKKILNERKKKKTRSNFN
ncbi:MULTISPECIES: hypothetical protein [Bacillus]|nr:MULTISPECIES: hypothetical protein [Bacillus]MED1096466.1 hypothetical protein [Bacillus capparidis]